MFVPPFANRIVSAFPCMRSFPPSSIHTRWVGVPPETSFTSHAPKSWA